MKVERTLAARAYAVVHEAIIKGELKPGDRLRIEDLAAQLQVSPTPIREVLHRLEGVGLVEQIPHRGARVTELRPADLRDLYETRFALEPLAVAKAAQRFTPEIEAKAREALHQQMAAEKLKDPMEAWKAHTAFHFALYEASGSPWLVRLITPLWESSQRYRMALKQLREELRQRAGEHESLLGACAAHDSATASTLLYNHLARTANRIALDLTGSALFDLQKRPELDAGHRESAVANQKSAGDVTRIVAR